MAASAALSVNVTAATAPLSKEFQGLKASTSFSKVQSVAMLPRSVKGKGALGARCDFIGSPTNIIIVASTTLMLFAGRFGLAPSANRKALAGLKLVDRDSGLQTGDPAGFTATDTLACGVMGHIIGVGIVLGLKGIGVL
jgi:photosystem I subunit 10